MSTGIVVVAGVALAVACVAACSVSPDEERAMGRSDAAQIDSQLPLLDDTVVTSFVSALGQSMASHTSRADLDWRFTVINSPEVNAFALPGGFIYVNRGAIENADRLDELAGIMGHEIGHVVRRHSVKQLEKAERGDVAIVLLCTMTRVCHTVGGAVAVRTGADAMAARYSQRDEAQADSEGVINTARAGIDPEGLPSFFQKLLDTRNAQPTALAAFFSTHPTDQSRIAATRREVSELPRVPGQTLLRDTPEFQNIKARVHSLPPPPPTHSNGASK